jgi:hypothetical protein
VILAKVTLLQNCQYNTSLKVWHCCGNMCFRLLCVSSAVHSVTILQKGNFRKDHHKLPEDGPNGPKHVGANV